MLRFGYYPSEPGRLEGGANSFFVVFIIVLCSRTVYTP